MSWQDYVDVNLVGSGKVSRACIIGLDGGVWASSPGFQVSGDEATKLLKAFQDPSGIRANGLYANGQRVKPFLNLNTRIFLTLLSIFSL
jgi:profilin